MSVARTPLRRYVVSFTPLPLRLAIIVCATIYRSQRKLPQARKG